MASITKLLLLLFVLSLLLLNVCSSESAAKKKKRRKKRRTRIPEGSSVSSSGSAAQEALSLFNQAQESAEIQKGIQFYKEALRLHPVFPMATWNLGLLYQQSQQFSELEALYSKALSVVHKTSEQEDLSGGSMARQLSAEPTVTTAHQLSSGTVSVVQVPYRAGVLFYLANLRGSFLRQQQQAASDDDTQRIVKDLSTLYNEALNLHPDYADASFECGAAWLNIADRPDEAVPYFYKALNLKPDFAEAAVNLGLALKSLGRVPEAIAMLQKGVKLAPTMAAAQANLGVVLQDVGRLDEAVDAYRSAVKLRPDMSVLNFNLAQALEAQQAAAQTPKHRSPNEGAQNDIGDTSDDQSAAKDIEQLHLQAIRLNPNATSSLCALVLGRLYALDWRERDELLQRIRLTPERSCGNAFYSAATSGDIVDLTNVAAVEAGKMQADARRLQSERPWRKHLWSRNSSRPTNEQLLKVAFVSSDFGAHSVGSLLHRVFQHFSRRRLRVICVATSPDDGTSMRKDFQGYFRGMAGSGCDEFEQWDSARGFPQLETSDDAATGVPHPNEQLFRLLSKSDILIDLNGLSRGHVGHVLSARPTISLAFLGFPSSSGGAVDYFATDALTSPPDIYAAAARAAKAKGERVVLLPRSYIVSSYFERDPHPEERTHLSESVRFFTISSAPTSVQKQLQKTTVRQPSSWKLSRDNSDLRLPKSKFVFCSFGQLYKITPPVLDDWANLLRRTPNSMLWLLRHPSAGNTGPVNFLGEMAARGISLRRIVVMDHVSLTEHISLKRLGDLHLDTFPYNGHTTALDALWAGLPHVTLSGTAGPSRVGASVLSSLNPATSGLASGEFPPTAHAKPSSSGGWRGQSLATLFQTNSHRAYETAAARYAGLVSNAHVQIRQHIDSIRSLVDGFFSPGPWSRSFERALAAVYESRHVFKNQSLHVVVGA